MPSWRGRVWKPYAPCRARTRAPCTSRRTFRPTPTCSSMSGRIERPEAAALVRGDGERYDLARASWKEGIQMQLRLLAGLAIAFVIVRCADETKPTEPATNSPPLSAQGPLNPRLVAQGKTIFRFETYGDE